MIDAQDDPSGQSSRGPDVPTLRARVAELELQIRAEPLPRRREVLEVAVGRLRALAQVAESRDPSALLA